MCILCDIYIVFVVLCLNNILFSLLFVCKENVFPCFPKGKNNNKFPDNTENNKTYKYNKCIIIILMILIVY